MPQLDLTFFSERLSACSDGAVRVEICALLTTLLQVILFYFQFLSYVIYKLQLQGAVDIGMNLVTNERATAMMLEMAASDNFLHQVKMSKFFDLAIL